MAHRPSGTPLLDKPGVSRITPRKMPNTACRTSGSAIAVPGMPAGPPGLAWAVTFADLGLRTVLQVLQVLQARKESKILVPLRRRGQDHRAGHIVAGAAGGAALAGGAGAAGAPAAGLHARGAGCGAAGAAVESGRVSWPGG